MSLPVVDLDAALAFYEGKLGHVAIWRREAAAGLRLPESEAELVLHMDKRPAETDLLVESVTEAIDVFTRAGGSVLVDPLEIAAGQWAVPGDT